MRSESNFYKYSKLKYSWALNSAIACIIDYATQHNCDGCPLKGSGENKRSNSCKNRLIKYFMKD
ncbi:hypothetical protein SAMN05660299_00279 [Megasphaera paucivorans]|uniref:Uncharacterized protein n=1 Tax=Megasphaera paucivorans TaxID=349095 RepID=A0A1G9QU78_9FIRM|nr:hypothetical protein SAMN05660299_00279 [Megasphaera paucivorans]